jgi:hypothetical protein
MKTRFTRERRTSAEIEAARVREAAYRKQEAREQVARVVVEQVSPYTGRVVLREVVFMKPCVVVHNLWRSVGYTKDLVGGVVSEPKLVAVRGKTCEYLVRYAEGMRVSEAISRYGTVSTAIGLIAAHTVHSPDEDTSSPVSEAFGDARIQVHLERELASRGLT